MQIGPADAPRVMFRDSYGSVCANNDSPSTQFVAQGMGISDGSFLNLTFTRSGCGSLKLGGYEDRLYHDPGSDTLWSGDPDDDGWGLVWYRVN